MHWLPLREREERDDHIVDLYRRGFTQRQIGERVGLRQGSIYYILKKRGIKKIHDYPRIRKETL